MIIIDGDDDWLMVMLDDNDQNHFVNSFHCMQMIDDDGD